MLDAAARKLIDPPLNAVGRMLAHYGIPADAVTASAVTLMLSAGTKSNKAAAASPDGEDIGGDPKITDEGGDIDDPGGPDALPQRHKKRKRLYHKDSSIIRLRPQYPNNIWSVDFVHDRLSNGRSYKMLTVLDEYTRQALCVAVKSRMGSAEVLEALYPLLLRHGNCRRSSRHRRSTFL